MKYRFVLAAVLWAAVTVIGQAAVTLVDTNYNFSSYYENSSANGIVSFDWDSSGDLYYMDRAGQYDYSFGGLYKVSGSTTTTVVNGTSDWAGSSVVSIGGTIYYNTSNTSLQKIYAYDVAGASSTRTSTASNNSIIGYKGSLYVAGSVSGGTKLGVATPATDGSLPSGGAVTLFTSNMPGAASGPMAFDSAGNLYYAPGYGDSGIYRWSATEVSLALSDPVNNALIASSAWFTFGSEYANVTGYNGGATSMVIDADGNVFLTLTDWANASDLVKVSADASSANTVATDSGRFSELREKDGNLYVSSGQNIYLVQAVPEPCAALLMVMGAGMIAVRRRLGSQKV